uniref:Uncharacterized protein n=1 Tax=Nothobranchius furzeri TaxID=105023 RepID=A0A8C6VRI1_NOTFU
MAGRARVVQLLRQLERVTCRCPAHSNTFYQGVGALSSTDRKTEYAFEMASSNIRYGAGVSREIVMSCVGPRGPGGSIQHASGKCVCWDRLWKRRSPSVVRNLGFLLKDIQDSSSYLFI